ncbi:MAG: SDR family oxidoreductase [Lentisphaerae bacterium]|nr:SDR family oxidoreductase [Lentisphaerota bacterium]
MKNTVRRTIQDRLSLDGKRALVTGSSRGIGQAIAITLAEAGAEVVFHASSASERLDKAVQEAIDLGFKAKGVGADISSEEGVNALIESSGDIDILVLNASAQVSSTVENFTIETFDREYRTNVLASCLLMRAFLPGMRDRQYGRIVTLGSVNEHRPSPDLCVYASTKAAQHNILKGMVRPNAKFGITCNNLSPGVIETDRNKSFTEDPVESPRVKNWIPAKRFGTPDDCSMIVLLLCSEAGSYITGADILISGGI